MTPQVRIAGRDDADAIGRLLYAFNREFGDPTPEPSALAERMRQLLDGTDTVALLAGEGPDGLAVLRLRLAIWSAGLECYLAELYVAPARRGQGLGRLLMEAVLREARDRGADTMDIGVDEPDIAARRLYESLGFTNRAGGDGPVMYFYERDLLARVSGRAVRGGVAEVRQATLAFADAFDHAAPFSQPSTFRCRCRPRSPW